MNKKRGLQHPFICKGIIPFISHDHMIQQGQVQCSSDLSQPFRQFPVLFGRNQVSRWMVMGYYHRGGIRFQGCGKNHLGIHHRTRCSTAADGTDSQDPIGPTEQHKMKILHQLNPILIPKLQKHLIHLSGTSHLRPVTDPDLAAIPDGNFCHCTQIDFFS